VQSKIEGTEDTQLLWYNLRQRDTGRHTQCMPNGLI
jgi:hypothetical protein